MSRRAATPQSALKIGRFLVCLVAVAALLVGTVAPSGVASASNSSVTLASGISTTASAADVVSGGAVKTSLVGFNAGNLISDAVFYDKNTLTLAQIDAFFKSKVAKCQSGYTCLKDFKQSTPNRPADKYCNGYTGAAGESAASIIFKVAQSCGLNPQVFIVMLQKEQALITHTWPSQWRYDMALGQGCPDDAPCNPQFAGFFYQIYGAARQMKIYTEGKWFTWYAPGKTWQVQYHPNRGCGTGPLYIQNAPTAALYYYTPYQPNAAALRAGYGTGDSCSSYGNRNFYNYFTDWFGSTQVAANPPTPPVTPPVSPTAPPTPPGSSTIPLAASLQKSNYTAAVDSAGVLWGYPFANSQWGTKAKIADGFGSVSAILPVGDLNGNGQRDFLLRQGTKVSIMRGVPGGFTPPVTLNLDWSKTVLATAVGDLDGDGVPDVLTTNTAGDLLLWRGDNKGSLLPGIKVGNGWTGMDLLLGGVDLNRDGHMDLIGRNKAGYLWGYYGNGRGGWSSQQQLGHGWGGMATIFSPGDFTGDGIADLAGRHNNGDLYLYPGNGKGSIGSTGKIGNGWQIMRYMSGSSAPLSKARALPAGVGDVDRDGASDVLALTAQGTLQLYRGDGKGNWRTSQQIGAGFQSGDRLIPMGDFNGDGYRDLGRILTSGQFMLYPGQAGGRYGAGIVIGNGWQALSLVTGGIDYDGDRIPDVIARDAAGNLVLYRGDGKGGWAGGAKSIGMGWGSFDLAFNAGDFDGDGHSDLMVRRTNGTLWLYPTKSNGTWGTAKQVGNGWGSFTAVFSPGDFDGNGTPDVLARTAAGDLLIFRGNGRGGFGASNTIGRAWQGFTEIR